MYVNLKKCNGLCVKHFDYKYSVTTLFVKIYFVKTKLIIIIIINFNVVKVLTPNYYFFVLLVNYILGIDQKIQLIMFGDM